jgi:hypothetical protein
MLLHFIGTSLVVITIIFSLFTLQFKWLLLCPVLGYSFAWSGHFMFEKNKPAAFKKPYFSLICDFKMWYEIISLKRKI